MKSVPTIAAAAVIAATLAACGANSKPIADPTSATLPKSTHATTTTTPSTPAPSSHPTSTSSAKATTLDPCQLVTGQEASALAHASFGPGHPETTNGGRVCVYGSATTNVLDVFVAQAASAAEAQAEWNKVLADAKAGVANDLGGMAPTLTAEHSLADRAEWVEVDLPSVQVTGRGLAMLSGDVGFYMVDLVRGAAAPGRPALSAQAQIVLSRLP